jgi:hypothetical protein
MRRRLSQSDPNSAGRDCQGGFDAKQPTATGGVDLSQKPVRASYSGCVLWVKANDPSTTRRPKDG